MTDYNKSKFCYRLRPMNDLTIDELNNHYLWFSKRSGFKDRHDANIGAFIEDTPHIRNGLKRIYTESEINEIIKEMDNIGICCFTKKMPSKRDLGKFPRGGKSICIRYNKKKLEDFFENSKYALANPFNDVVYDDEPTKIETDGSYHILWEKQEFGNIYRSINNIFADFRTTDKLFQKLLTRINSKYREQRELRIILGGRNLADLDTAQPGYKIVIPECAVSKVYLFSNSESSFCKELGKIDYLKDKIEFLGEE